MATVYRQSVMIGGLMLSMAAVVLATDGETSPLPISPLASSGSTNAQPVTPPATQPAATPAPRKMGELTTWILDTLKKYQPDVYEQAVKLRDSEPAKFDKLMRDSSGYFRTIRDKQKSNPPLFEAYVQDLKKNYDALQIVKQMKSGETPADQKDALKASLSKVVSDQFEIRQKIRQLELDELTAKVEQLRKTLADRQADKDNQVAKRVDDLLKSTPPLNW